MTTRMTTKREEGRGGMTMKKKGEAQSSSSSAIHSQRYKRRRSMVSTLLMSLGLALCLALTPASWWSGGFPTVLTSTAITPTRTVTTTPPPSYTATRPASSSSSSPSTPTAEVVMTNQKRGGRAVVGAVIVEAAKAAAAAASPKSSSNPMVEQKWKTLNSLTKDGDGILGLETDSFHKLSSSQRNASVLVVFTALSPSVRCTGCHLFDKAFREMAYSWQAAHPKHPLYFALLDFENGRDAFEELEMQSVPHMYLYPADTGDHALADIHNTMVNYDLQRRGFSGQEALQWLSSLTKTSVPYKIKPDYTLYAMVAGIVVGVVVTLPYTIPLFLKIVGQRKLWAIASLSMILMFTGGAMWNRIRNPPFAGGKELVSRQFSYQHAVETQILAVLNGVGAFAVVALTIAVPKVTHPQVQRIMTVVFTATMVIAYASVVKVFMLKSPSYPFRVLPLP